MALQKDKFIFEEVLHEDKHSKLLGSTNIFLSGGGLLCQQIAKDLLDAGVKKLTLHTVKCHHNQAGFALDQEEITSRNRLEQLIKEQKKQESDISLKQEERTFDQIPASEWKLFDFVVLTESSFKDQVRINRICREQNPPVKFISTNVLSLYAYIFIDVGPLFTISDADEKERLLKYELLDGGKRDAGGSLVAKGHTREGLDVECAIEFYPMDLQLDSAVLCKLCCSNGISTVAVDLEENELVVNDIPNSEKIEGGKEQTLSLVLSLLGGLLLNEIQKILTKNHRPLHQWSVWKLEDFQTEYTKSSPFLSDCTISEVPRSISHHKESMEALSKARVCLFGCKQVCIAILRQLTNLTSYSAMDISICLLDDRKAISRMQGRKEIQVLVKDLSDGVFDENNEISVRLVAETEMRKDTFIGSQKLIVSALDTVTARSTLSRICVKNDVKLIDVGLQGSKAHVQVIVPHETESYSAVQEAPTPEVPYCTLKSFPECMYHAVAWAREKFLNRFCDGPDVFNTFWRRFCSPSKLCQALGEDGNCPEGFILAMKLLLRMPRNWQDCLILARRQFDVDFNFKARQLLHSLPPTLQLPDGSLFWSPPKRIPQPIVFDPGNAVHLVFVKSTAKLLARVFGVALEDKDLTFEEIRTLLSTYSTPEFKAGTKDIETSPEAKKEKQVDLGKVDSYMQHLKTKLCNDSQRVSDMRVQQYSKYLFDEDHLNFIYSASNLRAAMYGIEGMGQLAVKKMAGQLLSFEKTALTIAAALVSEEITKILGGCSSDAYCNTFLNLALPSIIRSAPGPPTVYKIREDLTFTEWDRWEVHGNPDFTLADFIQHFRELFQLEIGLIVQGVKIIFMPFMPGHTTRLKKRMIDLLDVSGAASYRDLTISFETDDDPDEPADLPAPPVRYWMR